MSSAHKLFSHKKIAFLGLGIENLALLRWLLSQKIEAEFIICDQRAGLKEKYPEFRHPDISWQLGADYDAKLAPVDMISRIAGYPLFSAALKKALRQGTEISSPAKLFFSLCPTKNIIGISGTKGKGTTSALILEILNSAGQRAHWGGNIGIPMFSFIDRVKKTDWVVLELSSFQLEDIEASPHIGVLTNLSREHLRPADPVNPNYHKTYEDYIAAKLNLFRYQGRGDYAVINKKIDFASAKTRRGRAYLGRGKKIYFSRLDYPSRLPGEHNQENIAAAAAAARLAGVREAVIRKAVKKFKGLEHRLEFAGEAGDIAYYDDSFATTPESSIIAIRAFQSPIVLLAGGADKGANFKKLAREIKKRVKTVVLFQGEATPRLKKELVRIDYPAKSIESAKSMKEAFFLARKNAVAGDTILLSPACASFGIFRDYKERGALFKEELRKVL